MCSGKKKQQAIRSPTHTHTQDIRPAAVRGTIIEKKEIAKIWGLWQSESVGGEKKRQPRK